MRNLSCIALAFAMIIGHPVAAMKPKPLVIAHRGASADRPEHTLAAYRLAIEQGADFIEPDLVPTKDGHLVARHESEISGSTNVAEIAAFASRKATKTIDGQSVTGWFTEDFTLAELKTLKARERLPQLRPGNVQFDGQETIPTFDEVLALARQAKVGVYPETKHPAYFRSIGLPLEEPLLEALQRYGLTEVTSPVFIQSFETANLKSLRKKTRVRLIQLAAGTGAPADSPQTSYASMLTSAGLQAIAAYADGIGVEKSTVIPRKADGRLGPQTTLVSDAHKVGLKVHVWTFRPENFFLPAEFRKGDNPIVRGDAQKEIHSFLATGIDGLFSDSVPDARAALQSPPAAAGRPKEPAPR